MDFDFPTIMVLAVFVTGVIWLFDVLVQKPKRIAQADLMKEQGAAEPELEEVMKEPVLAEYARSFFPVILVVLILRSFLVEPFRIPSGSMMPTLVDGDFILVNKYAYGIRLPVLEQKVIELGDPERGDVVVFRYPLDPSSDYIKRIIGVPGDTVQYIDKKVYINGELMPLEYKGTYSTTGAGVAMTGAGQFSEDLGGLKHDVLIMKGRRGADGELTIPEGSYFVMGDNRDNSNDSRMWGVVPDENLVGRAFMIWMNWDGVQNRVSWERIGTMID